MINWIRSCMGGPLKSEKSYRSNKSYRSEEVVLLDSLYIHNLKVSNIKYAASHVNKFSAMKKPMICQLPELNIGEGGGCVTYWARENEKSKMTI
jgi:hypothetical protein